MPAPLWCQSWASVHAEEHLKSTTLWFCAPLPTLPQSASLLLQAGMGCSQVDPFQGSRRCIHCGNGGGIQSRKHPYAKHYTSGHQRPRQGAAACLGCSGRPQLELGVGSSPGWGGESSGLMASSSLVVAGSSWSSEHGNCVAQASMSLHCHLTRLAAESCDYPLVWASSDASVVTEKNPHPKCSTGGEKHEEEQ